MEELRKILMEIDADVDYDHEDNLIDGKIFDSFSIINLISEICDTFEIEISPKWMKNENFNSMQAMWKMITAIKEEE